MKYQEKFRLFILGLFLIAGLNSFAQDKFTITGQVLNSQNEPVEGVSISLEGQLMSPFITGQDGSFSITSAIREFWVIYTPFEKYKTRRVFNIGSREDITVYLTDIDLEAGSDIVLDIGSEQERRNIVSSIHTINTKDFDYLPYQSIGQFLQGTLPGGLFTSHSGMPGSGGTISLRGQTSLFANNMPLIIVDGLPLENGSLYNPLVTGGNYNPLSVIAPQDVSSISILRGASTALYGAKGSNGVILIETLKPRDIATTIEFSFKAGINSFVGNKLPQLNARQYKTLANEILASSGYPEEMYPILLPGLFLSPGDDRYINYSHDYNWQQDIFEKSYLRDAYFNIQGGDAIGRYALSVGYLDHEGIFKNTGFNRFTSRFSGTFNMFEWLRISMSANLVSSTSLFKASGLTRETSPIITSLAKSPMHGPYQWQGDTIQLDAIQEVDEFGISNPKSVMELYEAKNSNTRFLTSIKAEGNITRDLSMNSLFAINVNSLRQNAFLPNQGMELYFNLEVWNSSQTQTSNLFSMFNDNYLQYTKSFNNIHRLNIMAGAKWTSNRFEEDFALAKNLNPNDQFVYLQAGSNILNDIGGDILNWNWLSAYSRINYTLLDRYLFEINASGDLSSNVGREALHVFLINDLPYGAFYSGALSWRISRESFLRNLSSLEDWRINLEYGVTGNDDVGTRNSRDYYRLVLYRETSGMIPASAANTALGFERSNFYTVGTDISLLGNRFRFSFDYHHTAISDMLVYERLSSYIGNEYYPSNNADMVNKVYEFNVFGRVINTGNFKFDLSLNLAKIENEITDITGGEIVTEIPGFAVINRIGEKANSFYGYSYEGVFSTTEEAKAANLVNRYGVPFTAGDAKFKDISGPGGVPDGIINDFDRMVLGSGRPDLFGGVNLSISYKNLSLSTLWQFVYGKEIFNYIRYQNERMADISNQSITTLRRWSYEGHETDMPKAKLGDRVGNSDFSSRWLEDGSYVRCQNIMLSYKMPEKFILFNDFTIFGNVVNPFTFTKYLGYDPEFSYSYSTFVQGADYGLMPQSRKIMFGVKIGL